MTASCGGLASLPAAAAGQATPPSLHAGERSVVTQRFHKDWHRYFPWARRTYAQAICKKYELIRLICVIHENISVKGFVRARAYFLRCRCVEAFPAAGGRMFPPRHRACGRRRQARCRARNGKTKGAAGRRTRRKGAPPSAVDRRSGRGRRGHGAPGAAGGGIAIKQDAPRPCRVSAVGTAGRA